MNSMLKFTLGPYDVLYFGSGRPFNRGDVVDSVFPPYPHTFAGAICSKFKDIDATSILRAVYGPFIKRGSEIYFPKPYNIYSERKKQEHENFFVVEPPKEKQNLFNPENTNKPEEVGTLPTYKGTEEIEPFDGFISIGGLKKWLNGQKVDKDEILGYKNIFENEPRVGISIDPAVYSVGSEEDALYRIEFLRLKENFEFVFWAEFDFSDELKKVAQDDEGLRNFFNLAPRGLKLGGETRNVYYDVEVSDFKDYIIKNLGIDENIDLDKNEKIQLLFLTYGIFDFCDSEKRIPQIDGFKMFSACYGNYRIVGLRSKNIGMNNPRTKRAYPPGTVFWLESNNGKKGLKAISFLTKSNNRSYCLGEAKGGRQDFIGANLVLIKKGG